MKKAVALIFFMLLLGTSPLYAETVIMDESLDYHIRGYITVYEGYSIYSLEIVDTNKSVSYGLLAIQNPSPLSSSSSPFVIIGLEDQYWSFAIQGYWDWKKSSTVAYLSTNNVAEIGYVTLSVGEQRY